MAGHCRMHVFRRFISEMATFKKKRCGQVAEWSNAPDCKSGALVAT